MFYVVVDDAYDWIDDAEELYDFMEDHKIEIARVTEHGPAGGNQQVEYIGLPQDLTDLLDRFYDSAPFIIQYR
jgi:hypothetical protein